MRTTLQHAGYEVQTARTVADFTRRLAEDAPALALINTAIVGVDWRAAIAAARAAQIPVIAFGSHVDLETQQQARQAGATRVIANSKLATDLPTSWAVRCKRRRRRPIRQRGRQRRVSEMVDSVYKRHVAGG